MTFDDDLADERLSAPQPPTRRGDGVNPVSERGVDQQRAEFMRELEEQPARPLTADERRAAALDSGRAASVFAPASERVGVEPLPGDREIVDHLDTLTSERRAARSQTGVRGIPRSAPPGDPT